MSNKNTTNSASGRGKNLGSVFGERRFNPGEKVVVVDRFNENPAAPQRGFGPTRGSRS